ncbi:NADH-quinone oxidoreductase subunit C [Streptomyces hebeiensis]
MTANGEQEPKHPQEPQESRARHEPQAPKEPYGGYDRLPDAAAEIFGEGASAESAYGLLTVDVPAASWLAALETARDRLGCVYFDWLSAVDEPGTGFRVCAHVVALAGGTVRGLLVRTTVPHDAAVLPSAVHVYAGAAWHERETHEMFGVSFTGHPHLAPLLLPEEFEGHPLRKDFVLAARVAKAWPGAKEPGESEHGGPKRRQMLPPGVPDPNEWGPLKGQLPPAPARPARGARAGGGAAGRAAGAAGERPARRTRSASEGSAGSRAATGAPGRAATGAPSGTGVRPERDEPATDSGPSAEEAAARPAEGAPGRREAGEVRETGEARGTRKTRDVSPDGTTTGPVGPGGAPEPTGTTGTAGTAEPAATAESAGTAEPPDTARKAPPSSSDAPWHSPRPAFADRPERDGRRTDGPRTDSPRTDGPGASDPQTDSPENGSQSDRPDRDRPEGPEGDA